MSPLISINFGNWQAHKIYFLENFSYSFERNIKVGWIYMFYSTTLVLHARVQAGL